MPIENRSKTLSAIPAAYRVVGWIPRSRLRSKDEIDVVNTPVPGSGCRLFGGIELLEDEMTRRLIGAVAALALSLGLVACSEESTSDSAGSNASGTPGGEANASDSEGELTPEAILDRAQQKMDDLESFTVETESFVSTTNRNQPVDSHIEMTIDVFTQPLKARVSVDDMFATGMDQPAEQNLGYIEQTDGGTVMYTYAQDEWARLDNSPGSIGEYSIASFMQSLDLDLARLAAAEDLTMQDDGDTWTFTGTLNIAEDSENVGHAQLHTVVVDKDDNYVQELAVETEFVVTEVTTTQEVKREYSNFNDVPDFSIPEEARNALVR